MGKVLSFRRRSRAITTPLYGAGIVMTMLGSAHAQQQVTLEEVIVTAERRERSLQDTPVAVTAISAEQLLNSGLSSVQDLRYAAPSLTFRDSNGPRGEGFNIRGVGTQSFSDGVEQSVGIVVDGVVMGATGIGNNALADIERVEVLRGPQGTLFGKNASAGVISVVTRKPELGTWSARTHLKYGEHNDRNLQGVLNAPLGDSTAVRLSGYSTHHDGILTNLATGEDDLNERDEYGFRGKLRWQPSDAFEINVIADWAERDQDCCTSTPRSAGVGTNPYSTYWNALGLVPAPNQTFVTLDGDPDSGKVTHSFVKDRGVSTQIDYRLGNYTLTSITAYRRWAQTNLTDSDSVTVDILDVNTAAADQKQLTQELRLTSPAGEKLEYVAGLFYFDSTFDIEASQGGAVSAALAPTSTRFLRQFTDEYTNESYAAFASGTYNVTADLRLIAGARYTHDEVAIDLHSFFDPNYNGRTYLGWPGQVFPLHLVYSTDEDNVSWKGGLQYDVTPDVMSYLTVSRGYKGPTFYASLDSDPTKSSTPVDPELSTNYEIGLKSTWLDNRLLLNLAAFWTDFDDFQTTVAREAAGIVTFTLANAGGLRTRGVELEFVAKAADMLTFSGGVTYADSTYTDFQGAPCYRNQPASTDPKTGCAVINGVSQTDASGKFLGGQSKWLANVTADYQQPIGATLLFNAFASYYWRDKFNFSSVGDPNTRHDAYGILNGNIGIGSDDGRWRVGVYGRNLLDKQFAAVIGRQLTNDPGNATTQFLTTDAQRTVGVFADFSF